jgi:hypothetical protein
MITIIPVLTPKLSSYWVDLVTPVGASLARPLVESLKHESIVKDHSIEKIIPLKLRTFRESLEYCLREENKYKKSNKNPKQKRENLVLVKPQNSFNIIRFVSSYRNHILFP